MSGRSLSFALDGPEGAPVLVVSPSLGTSRDLWLPQVPVWSRRFRLVRVDHPGHGESPIWDSPVTVEGIGRAVVDVFDKLDLEHVHFCGLSLGGAVAQWIAAHAPERIERLILCSTSARFAGPEAYLQRAATVREQGTAAIAGSVIERWFTAPFREQHPEVAAHYRSMIEEIPAPGYAACCEAVAGFDGRDNLQSISAPTLIIAGRDDPATTIDHARQLHDGIDSSRLEVIPDAAHLTNVEQPHAFTDAVLSHLREEPHGG